MHFLEKIAFIFLITDNFCRGEKLPCDSGQLNSLPLSDNVDVPVILRSWLQENKKKIQNFITGGRQLQGPSIVEPEFSNDDYNSLKTQFETLNRKLG